MCPLCRACIPHPKGGHWSPWGPLGFRTYLRKNDYICTVCYHKLTEAPSDERARLVNHIVSERCGENKTSPIADFRLVGNATGERPVYREDALFQTAEDQHGPLSRSF